MKRSRIFGPLLLAVLLWNAPPVRAAEKLIEVDATVNFALTEPGMVLDFPVRVLRPGLLAFETDMETLNKLKVEVQDSEGGVMGLGGARITRPGEYLVRVRRHPNYDGEGNFAGWDGLGQAVLGFWYPDPDRFEPNDTPKTASLLLLGEAHPLAGGPASLFPEGDADHFRLRLQEAGFVTLTIGVPGVIEANVDYWLEVLGDQGGDWRPGQTRLLPQGDYLVALQGRAMHPAPLQLSFDYLPNWDACDPNDSPEQACDLTDGRTISFSLYPARDSDWFTYLVERSGAVALAISGMPPSTYDQNGKLIGGLALSVNAHRVTDQGSQGVYSHITHGAVYFWATEPGEYRFALSGRWRGANAARAMGLTASFVDPLAGSDDGRLSIIGVYGDGRNDNISLALTVLAGLGDGRFTPTTSAQDIEAVVRRSMGIAPAATPTEPEPLDPELAGKNPKLVEALLKRREAAVAAAAAAAAAQAAQPARTRNPNPTEEQTANLPSPEAQELERLRQLQKKLEGSPEATLWRHHYHYATGSELKRLEATEIPELAEELTPLKSEQLKPRTARRLLTRAIQQLE